MREARLEHGRARFAAGHTARLRRARGIDLRPLAEAFERVLPVAEAVLQTAGYFVLTGGAVWLIWRFVP